MGIVKTWLSVDFLNVFWRILLAIFVVGAIVLVFVAYRWLPAHKLAYLLLGTMAICGLIGATKGVKGAWSYPLLFGFVIAAICAYLVKLVSPQQMIGIQAWFSTQPMYFADTAGMAGMIVGEFCGLIWLLWKPSQKGRRHDESHVHGLQVAENAAKGTARWASISDLMGFCAVGPPHKGLYGGGTILGKLDGQIVRVVKEKTAPPTIENAVWVAEPQKGKTTCGIIPNIIAAAEAGESLVITDPKGELTRLMYGYLKSKGYDVYVFNLDQPELGNCWNLVAECQDEEEISGAVETLVVNGQVTADKSGGYWLSKETQLLESLIYLLKADFPIEQQHLSSALSLAVWPEKVLNARFTTAYQEGRLPKVGFDSWQGTRTANLENAVSGLTAKLKVLRSGKIADLISKQEIDFTSIGKKKAALFCILPIGATHLKPVLSSFYYFFFRRLYALAQESGGRLPNPTRFLLDEFANIGQIGANFPETISTGPGLGITIQIVLQSVAQLYPTYGKDFATAILSCCPIKFWLGGTDKESARFFSDNLGTAAVYGESQKRDVTMHLTRRLKPNIKTESIVSRQLMEPYELGQDVKMDDEVVVISGSYPVRCKKMQWTELPQAAEINAINDSIREEKGINAGGRIKLEHLIAKNNNKAVTPDYPMGGDGDQGGHDAKMHSGRPPQKRGSEEVSIIRKIKPLDTIDDDDSIDDGTANNLGLK